MSWLTLLLVTKISVTALVALPLLFGPSAMLEATTGVSTQSPVFFRLYGVAITALLVGYGFGIPAAEHRQFPWGVVSMGLVSNAGAAYLLLRSATSRPTGFWLGIFFGLVAVAFAMSMTAPEHALNKAW
jgi:hypothetical protein